METSPHPWYIDLATLCAILIAVFALNAIVSPTEPSSITGSVVGGSCTTNPDCGSPSEVCVQGVCQTCATPIQSNMVSWWPGNGNAEDITSTNEGTLQNGAAASTPGVSGNAFSFDGFDDHVQIPNNPTLNIGSGFTLDTWFKAEPTQTESHWALIDKSHALSGFDGWALQGVSTIIGPLAGMNRQSVPGEVIFAIGSSSGFIHIGTGTNVQDGQFHHVAATWDGSQIKMYLDGILTETVPFTDTPIASSGDLYLGKWGSFSLRHFNGLLDEVHIFDRALSNSEVQSIFSSGNTCIGPVGPQCGNGIIEQGESCDSANLGGNTCATATSGQRANGTLSCTPTCTFDTTTCTEVCVTPPSNMVSWWPGEGNANDIQGSNEGTLQNGATFSSGKVGQAFTLDGIDDYISVQDSPTLDATTAITIDAWVKSELQSFEGGTIVSKFELVRTRPTEEFNGNYWFGISGGYLFFNHFNSVDLSEVNVNSAGQIPPGQYTHVAVTIDAGTLKFYINGVLDSTHSVGFGPVNNGLLTIGQSLYSSSPFRGQIDELEIHNRALIDTEIQSIANAGGAGKCKSQTNPCGAPQLKSWWPGDGNADDIVDANDGTPSNGLTFSTGKIGGAIDFATTHSITEPFVQLNNSLYNPFPATGFTYHFWVRPDFSATHPLIVLENAPYSPSPIFDAVNVIVIQPSGEIVMTLSTPTGFQAYYDWSASQAISAGTWQHVAITYKNTGDPRNDVGMYVNGVSKRVSFTKSPSAPDYTSSFNPRWNPTDLFTLGSPVEERSFHGLLDEVAFYTRDLSAPEIQTIYQNGAGNCKPGDTDGDGFPDSMDSCPAEPGTIDGCPFGLSYTTMLRTTCRGKDKTLCSEGGGSKTLPTVPVKTFDRAALNGMSIPTISSGTCNGPAVTLTLDPATSLYDDIYECAPSIGSCTTDSSGVCTTGGSAPSEYLAVAKYQDPISPQIAYTGEKGSARDFTGGLGQESLEFIRVSNRDGSVTLMAGTKTVVTGSILNIIYPLESVWDTDTFYYPFIFTSDSDWNVDVCAQLPQGYVIKGVYDESGNLITTTSCTQTFVTGETKVVAFDVEKTGSPLTWTFDAKLKLKHKGKTTKLDLKVPTKVKGAQKH